MNKKNLYLILCAALLCGTTARAAVLFDENFDGSPYSNNTAFNDPTNPVTGLNKLAHGSWSLNNAGSGVVSASTSASLSSNRSMALTVSANGDRAQAVGSLGATGAAATPTNQALTVKFSFNLQDVSQISYFLLRDTNDINLGYISLGGNAVRVSFGGVLSSISTISSNTWYNIEMTMSANPGTGGSNTYSVSLFNADFSSQLGSTLTGAFAQASTGGSYRYFTVYDQGYSGQTAPFTTYFDNISIVTVPEPSAMASLALGLVGLIMVNRFRRRSLNSLSSTSTL